MRAIINSICDEGINAEQRYIISSEEYRNSDTFLKRIRLRFRMYVEYPIRLAWFCLTDKAPRICIVTTNTFYAPLIAVLFSNKKQKVIHLVWDLYPEAILQNRINFFYKIASKIIRSIIYKTFTSAHTNVFLGKRLLNYAKIKYGNIENSVIIPVGADAKIFSENSPINLQNSTSKIEILYSGNLGAMHETETFITSLEYACSKNNYFPNLNISFNSSGKRHQILKERCKKLDSQIGDLINFGASMNENDWLTKMRSSHVALVTLKNGAENIVMPSKTYSALAAGQAILAICPFDSDLADLIINENCGWVVSPNDIEGFLQILNEIQFSPILVQTKRENAFRAGQTKFSNTGVAKSWIQLIRAVDNIEN